MNCFIVFAAFLFGLIFGSFANVCIVRIPENMSIINPGSFCPLCRKKIPWYLNIPLLSYILLKGKCRECGAKINIRYPLVEFITAVITASWFLRFDHIYTSLIFTVFGVFLVIISGIDIDHQIIAPELSYPLMILGVVFSPFNRFFSGGVFYSFLSMVVAGLVIFIIRALGNKAFGRESMGLGDLKLMMGIGAFTGMWGIFWTLFIASILGSLAGLFMKIAGRMDKFQYIPFGPYLAAAAVIYVNFSQFLLELHRI